MHRLHGFKPEARQKPGMWCSAAWGQHQSHLAELMTVHVCRGLTSLMLCVPLEGSLLLCETCGNLFHTTQPYSAFVPFRFVITDGEGCDRRIQNWLFNQYTLYNQA